MLNCFSFRTATKLTTATIATALLLAASLQAGTELSGSIGGMVLEASGNPYLVDADIQIPDMILYAKWVVQ